MAQPPVNQSFSEPPPPYSTPEATKGPYPTGAPPTAGYPPTQGNAPPPGFVAGPPPAGYPAAPTTTVVTTQPAVTVIRMGNCPKCQTGVMVDEYTCCGICLAICFFPLGLVCCLLMKDHRCNSCGYTA